LSRILPTNVRLAYRPRIVWLKLGGSFSLPRDGGGLGWR
jgi:hypothetical protein